MPKRSFNVDGTFVVAEYSNYTPASPGVTSGPPENCYPDEPSDVTLVSVWVALPSEGGDEVMVDVSDAEAFLDFVERVHDKLLEELDSEPQMGRFDYDYDYQEWLEA